MKAVHDFFYRRLEVPPMHVKDVDVRRAQFFEACFDAHVHVLYVVPDVIRLDLVMPIVKLVVSSVLHRII